MSSVKKMRLNIVEILFNINDINILKSIHQQLEKAKPKKKNGKAPSFMEAVKPIRTDVSLQEIMAEQNYQAITYKEFRKKADKLSWNESLDELLEALKN